MDGVLEGLLITSSVLILLTVLFRYEEVRGVRFGERFRIRADFFVLKIVHSLRTKARFFRRDFLKQIFRYGFHTVLFFILRLIEGFEKWLRTVMRTNKTMARIAERESDTLNKLEEIAIHKIETSLTEEEKQIRKDKTLQGL
ncbi:MAG: hypothetical protein K9M10_00735 [Candidatus Pacebacteria bacterium]|nr:hypothetical protein [Candidatus Paceibacterota bacterium]MCF7856989.1 hypothetical protein [Candidatus Paceibacterota bacterium]